ncbi:hypothetical protein OG440_13745 [Streptomyces sp. NBC_00637]|uniref:hypothetical protein n=1 Tax=Streptomyces sp. NBC_00637 TaxID=2903667 RepID=UPI003244B91C
MTATTATSATSGASRARTAGAGALLIMAALASASACWLVFARWLPSDLERYEDYRSAALGAARLLGGRGVSPAPAPG